MEFFRRAEIHFDAEGILKVELKAYVTEKRHLGCDVDEKIQVASVPVRTMDNGPEYAHIAGAARRCDGKYPISMGGKSL